MSGWVWIERAIVLAIHNEQLAGHGGLTGIRDEGSLESALARPLNLAAHHTPDCADFAAAYGFGICRNHPFMDGNKRTAFVVIELFLAMNGYELVAEDADCVLTMFALAAGGFEEPSLAAWIRERSVRR